MRRSPHKPILPGTLTDAERLHIVFIGALGNGKLHGPRAYSDGGATDRGRWARRRKGRAAKQARRRQRGKR